MRFIFCWQHTHTHTHTPHLGKKRERERKRKSESVSQKSGGYEPGIQHNAQPKLRRRVALGTATFILLDNIKSFVYAN